jgi:hypothetical protein
MQDLEITLFFVHDRPWLAALMFELPFEFFRSSTSITFGAY